MLPGWFLMAQGDKYDASKLIDLKPGAHSVVPATMPHFGLHKAGNVIEMYGEGPFAVNLRESGGRPEPSQDEEVSAGNPARRERPAAAHSRVAVLGQT